MPSFLEPRLLQDEPIYMGKVRLVEAGGAGADIEVWAWLWYKFELPRSQSEQWMTLAADHTYICSVYPSKFLYQRFIAGQGDC